MFYHWTTFQFNCLDQNLAQLKKSVLNSWHFDSNFVYFPPQAPGFTGKNFSDERYWPGIFNKINYIIHFWSLTMRIAVTLSTIRKILRVSIEHVSCDTPLSIILITVLYIFFIWSHLSATSNKILHKEFGMWSRVTFAAVNGNDLQSCNKTTNAYGRNNKLYELGS